MVHPIELAYRAQRYIPTADYRHGRRRKMYNPIRTTPALVQAMVHVGPQAMGLRAARERARQAVAEPDAARYIAALDWDALLAFLDTIAVFLKAGPQSRKERGMRTFEPRPEEEKERLDNQAISERAQALARDDIRGTVVKNKLKQMGAHVTAARDQWEALAALARFYPRNGIPKAYVDALVALLETADLRSFKQVVTQSLIFYEANT
jgi:hypothetical protein